LAARNEDDGLLLNIKSVVQLASKDRSIFTSYFSLATFYTWVNLGGTRGATVSSGGHRPPTEPPLVVEKTAGSADYTITITRTVVNRGN